MTSQTRRERPQLGQSTLTANAQGHRLRAEPTARARATALALARHGVRVVVAGRRAAPCDETVGLIRAAGGEAVARQTDVCLPADVAALVRLTVDTFGRLDPGVTLPREDRQRYRRG